MKEGERPKAQTTGRWFRAKDVGKSLHYTDSTFYPFVCLSICLSYPNPLSTICLRCVGMDEPSGILMQLWQSSWRFGFGRSRHSVRPSRLKVDPDDASDPEESSDSALALETNDSHHCSFKAANVEMVSIGSPISDFKSSFFFARDTMSR